MRLLSYNAQELLLFLMVYNDVVYECDATEWENFKSFFIDLSCR